MSYAHCKHLRSNDLLRSSMGESLKIGATVDLELRCVGREYLLQVENAPKGEEDSDLDLHAELARFADLMHVFQ